MSNERKNMITALEDLGSFFNNVERRLVTLEQEYYGQAYPPGLQDRIDELEKRVAMLEDESREKSIRDVCIGSVPNLAERVTALESKVKR